MRASLGVNMDPSRFCEVWILGDLCLLLLAYLLPLGPRDLSFLPPLCLFWSFIWFKNGLIWFIESTLIELWLYIIAAALVFIFRPKKVWYRWLKSVLSVIGIEEAVAMFVRWDSAMSGKLCGLSWFEIFSLASHYSFEDLAALSWFFGFLDYLLLKLDLWFYWFWW